MALTDNRAPKFSGAGAADPEPYQVVSADGAITLANGTVMITKGTACTITIDDPPADGVHVLRIISTTAAAHTITYTAGFGGGTTTRDVATFGGAISDGMVLVGYGGVWYISSTRNVTPA